MSNLIKFNNAIPEQLYNPSKFANLGSVELNNSLKILSESIVKINIDPDIFNSSINNIVKFGLEYQVDSAGTVSLNNEYIDKTKELEVTNEILNDDELSIGQKLYSIIERFEYNIYIFEYFYIFANSILCG